MLLTITNQATGTIATATSSADGSYTLSVAPGAYSVNAALKGFGRQTRKDLKVEAGGSVTADFNLQAQREEEVTVTATKHEEAIGDVPFAVAAPTEQVMQSRGIENIEGVAANVAGFAVQNLGPGQSQVSMRGVSSGQIVRDQPGVKEQVGAYLDESVISLVALHSGSRPFRCGTRRDPARTSGDALRFGVSLRDRSLHQQPARVERVEVVRASSAATPSPAGRPAEARSWGAT